MNTFLVERTIPPAFHSRGPRRRSRMHARWAVGCLPRRPSAFWLGGVVTEDRMCSLVTAEAADDLAPLPAVSCGIADAGHRSCAAWCGPIGPYFAGADGDRSAVEPALTPPRAALKSGGASGQESGGERPA